MLIHLIKSTCEQINQEEYKRHEKESDICSLCFSIRCKLQRRPHVSSKILYELNCFMDYQNVNVDPQIAGFFLWIPKNFSWAPVVNQYSRET